MTKVVSSIIIILFLIPFFIYAQGNDQDEKVREKGMEILNNNKKKIFYVKSEIPLNFLDILSKQRGEIVKLANPNEDWNATDLIINSKLPRRQLHFVIRSNKDCVIVYEHGGIGSHTHIFLYADKEIKWGVTGVGVESIDDLKKRFFKKNYFHTTYVKGDEFDSCL